MNKKLFHDKNILAALAALLVIVPLLTLYPVLQNDFVNWDDEEYVLTNESIRDFSAENIKTVFTKHLTGKYHPLTFLTFAVEYHFFQLTPFYYHATNLLLHLANVLLVFWLLKLFLGDILMAFVAALLFGIHPLSVEPVAWVSSRKDVLFFFFYILGLIAYVQSEFHGATKSSPRHKALVYFFFVLSLLSKAMAVTFPLVLILFDYQKSKHFDVKSVVRKWPLFLIAVCYGVFTMLNAGASQAFPNTGLYPLWERVLYSFLAFVLYMYKVIWPPPLACLYTFDITWASLFIAVVIVLLGGTLVYFTFRRKSLVPFCFFFTILTIWPALHFFQMNDSLIYDRFMYLPSIGIFILAAYGLKRALNARRKYIGYISAALFALWLLFLGVTSHRQTRVWNNSATLWAHTVKYFPNATAYNNLGVYLEKQGRFDEALVYFMRMIEADPEKAEGYFKLGNILAIKFDRTGAIRYYSKAVEYDPGHFRAYNNRGNQYLVAGMYDRALVDYSKAISLKEDYLSAYVNRGMCYFAKEDYAHARKDFQKVLSLDPGHQPAREKLDFLKGRYRP